jgi:hypothetical protein
MKLDILVVFAMNFYETAMGIKSGPTVSKVHVKFLRIRTFLS